MSSQTAAAPAEATFDVEKVRNDFPALLQTIYEDQPLVYLDNAASSQKPRVVLDRMQRFDRTEHSNIHRGVHYLSQRATDAYEDARRSVARLIGSPTPEQCIFTRGTTEAINLVAATYGRQNISAGDEIVLSTMEHHSNIVPWQRLCEETGAKLKIIPITDDGEIIYDEYLNLLNERTKLVAVCHLSNALGTVNPVEQMIADAHAEGIPVLVDGAQSVPHRPVDVQEMDCDFFCFSSHKMFGPTGIGILWGRKELLENMPPYQGGGDMIDRVSFEKTTYAGLPHKFEAGTPPISAGIGMGAAAEYLLALDREAAGRHEDDLLAYGTDLLDEVGGVRVVGQASEKASVLSFVIDGVHPYDAGTILDRMGLAVRTGHHCTQPLMDRLGLPGTVRASLAFYNTRADLDRLAEGLRQVKQMLG